MFLTPLRYPGGKAQYISLVECYASKCTHNRYIEPFAGGAAIALHFAINRDTPVLINDKDPAIHSFWRSILNETDAFIERINVTPINMQHWYQCREVLAGNMLDSFETGFAAFYLNRCNFSGCLKATPIGGYHQTGKWRMDARFNKSALIQRIRTIAQHKGNIQVTNLDAIDLVKSKTNKHDFIYLDPPYYTHGKSLYSNYLDDDGHSHLAKTLNETPATWLMSYDKSSYIEQLYSDKMICTKTVRYSFLRKLKQDELLIYSASG